MYERFTDRAREVMQLANQEARRFNHEYIGTEHLLLGLIKEQNNAATVVLKSLGVAPQSIQRDVESIIAAGTVEVDDSDLPLTPRARRAVDYAVEETRNLRQDFTGTEHILLGLLREDQAVAAQLLFSHGLTLRSVRQKILAIMVNGVSELEREISNSSTLGEPPYPRGIAVEIDRLRKQTELAIARKDFEKAAALRDKANRLKKRARTVSRRSMDDELKPLMQRLESLPRDLHDSDDPSRIAPPESLNLLPAFADRFFSNSSPNA